MRLLTCGGQKDGLQQSGVESGGGVPEVVETDKLSEVLESVEAEVNKTAQPSTAVELAGAHRKIARGCDSA